MRAKSLSVTYPALMRQIDKLIDWYEEEGKGTKHIPLFSYQFRVFVEKHPNRIYRGYRMSQVKAGDRP